MRMLRDEVQTIYCEYADDVYRYILSLSRDPLVAEDVLQSTGYAGGFLFQRR